jgi:hypothetical protein
MKQAYMKRLKSYRIGQSAANSRIEKGSTTIPQGSTLQANGSGKR